MKALSEVAKDALELRPEQRLTLARILLELSGTDEDFSPEVESAWEDEICRRLQAVKTGQAQARSYEEVFADLDRRFPS
ncbi:MAG: addiction module protein [Limisphaerales bacterium]